MKKEVLVIWVILMVFLAGVAESAGLQRGTPEYEASLIPDFDYRASLPQTDVPESEWYTPEMLRTIWGPLPKQFPGADELIAQLPEGTDITQWKRDRVVAIAKKYLGYPFRRHYIPAWAPKEANQVNEPGPGISCKDITAWVYNFGFGIVLNNNFSAQAQMKPRLGFSLPPGIQRIGKDGPFLPGDLIFLNTPGGHVVIYVDKNNIIEAWDGPGSGWKVAMRDLGKRRELITHAWRIFN